MPGEQIRVPFSPWNPQGAGRGDSAQTAWQKIPLEAAKLEASQDCCTGLWGAVAGVGWGKRRIPGEGCRWEASPDCEVPWTSKLAAGGDFSSYPGGMCLGRNQLCWVWCQEWQSTGSIVPMGCSSLLAMRPRNAGSHDPGSDASKCRRLPEQSEEEAVLKARRDPRWEKSWLASPKVFGTRNYSDRSPGHGSLHLAVPWIFTG